MFKVVITIIGYHISINSEISPIRSPLRITERGCNPVSSIFGAQLHAAGIFFFGVLLLNDMLQSSYLLEA